MLINVQSIDTIIYRIKLIFILNHNNVIWSFERILALQKQVRHEGENQSLSKANNLENENFNSANDQKQLLEWSELNGESSFFHQV